MKVVQFERYGQPDVLELRDRANPVPGPDQVLVAVKATSVNRLDLFRRSGARPVPELPFIPGLEAAGVVLADAHGFRAGERVLTNRAGGYPGGGGYAAQIVAPAKDLVRIPEGVSFIEAAAAGLAGSTAWAGLITLGHLEEGQRVLIWAGSSGVATIAIQIAKAKGAWVATTASSAGRAQKLTALGADLVVNHKTENVAEKLQALGGVNLVIELVSTTLQQSIDACTNDARVILIGNLGGKEATVDTQSWRLKRVQIIGGGMVFASPEDESKLLQLMASKQVKPEIAKVFPISQAAEAHRLLEAQAVLGKIVLTHEE